MKDNVSPEEKLLRLIRGAKKQDTTRHFIQKYPSFFNLRKIIWASFAVSCVYLAISLVYPLVGLKKIKLPKITSEKISPAKEEPKTETKPFEFYQAGIGHKQIFAGVSAPQTAQAPAVAGADLMKDINLVGILSGENPQAVIEDKKTQKTYYVTKGQFIGEMQVEDIQEGKIIISYRGQRYELYL